MEDIKDLLNNMKPGIGEEAIKEAEKQLGVTFPKQYKELFKIVNNPEIGDWVLYPIKDTTNLNKTWDDIVRQNGEVRVDYMSKDLIAIGDNGSGDCLCMKVYDGRMGDEIYIWYHEDGEIEEYAPNLREFIVMISEEDDWDDE